MTESPILRPTTIKELTDLVGTELGPICVAESIGRFTEHPAEAGA
ncbi:hypothetical protein [Nocardioides sp. NPDC127503]